jgi:hypothetical protein
VSRLRDNSGACARHGFRFAIALMVPSLLLTSCVIRPNDVVVYNPCSEQADIGMYGTQLSADDDRWAPIATVPAESMVVADDAWKDLGEERDWVLVAFDGGVSSVMTIRPSDPFLVLIPARLCPL